ncbi:hypothetical protein A3D11_02335 [Candidatus Peribacteria bacterium RIFCSPHIGHO2_02_FULL_49_16]|nr:MAG: hypothetical protein A2880_03795 [Candidatus Peribacteria bacterium RIFCSPHIGHO2_01_FULL_49_38]OGJ59963.1 MAG: hypothetical protein A3D11_02335 [Candidatus Peribacteria bacterium RIFCSPHIGHO2_02_FULL_49_16]
MKKHTKKRQKKQKKAPARKSRKVQKNRKNIAMIVGALAVLAGSASVPLLADIVSDDGGAAQEEQSMGDAEAMVRTAQNVHLQAEGYVALEQTLGFRVADEAMILLAKAKERLSMAEEALLQNDSTRAWRLAFEAQMIVEDARSDGFFTR